MVVGHTFHASWESEKYFTNSNQIWQQCEVLREYRGGQYVRVDAPRSFYSSELDKDMIL